VGSVSARLLIGHRWQVALQTPLPSNRSAHREPPSATKLSFEADRTERNLGIEVVLVIDLDGVASKSRAPERIAAVDPTAFQYPQLAAVVAHHHSALAEQRFEVRLLRRWPLGHQRACRAGLYLAFGQGRGVTRLDHRGGRPAGGKTTHNKSTQQHNRERTGLASNHGGACYPLPPWLKRSHVVARLMVFVHRIAGLFRMKETNPLRRCHS